MKSSNGNGVWWKILIAVAGGLVALGVAYATIGNNALRIDKIEPEVQKNSEHRLKDEEATVWMKEKISNIEVMQRQILEEVKK